MDFTATVYVEAPHGHRISYSSKVRADPPTSALYESENGTTLYRVRDGMEKRAR